MRLGVAAMELMPGWGGFGAGCPGYLSVLREIRAGGGLEDVLGRWGNVSFPPLFYGEMGAVIGRFDVLERLVILEDAFTLYRDAPG